MLIYNVNLLSLFLLHVIVLGMWKTDDKIHRSFLEQTFFGEKYDFYVCQNYPVVLITKNTRTSMIQDHLLM